ncbi:type I-F CRISPR-associated endoribonuclease Cas6/Csy4 [uncultured Endozoicomonas sp.]|uniref:type I-F CRISPR-associated endoribonuclease Cas6/Csy4 n=1 Tax=uncultured Endozoicomonas sp. TaxID=432652 RepID=UPI00260725EC|nr:type I-F CRISPR-associated endoribonuclease Cas6/Csy4 [uncultured Endozoicomonas sp.]
MQVYIDITLLPDDDIGHHFLWEKLFRQVHIALVDNKDAEGNSPFGIGFPEYHGEKHRLGRKLRVFAPSQSTMETLAMPRWLERLSDYVHITSIRPVPEKIEEYVRFQRLQTKSNPERLARRASKRQNISLEDALKQRANAKSQLTKAPYIWVRSLSNEERFRLFVTRESVKKAELSTFTHYGLAKKGADGAIPHF